MKKTYQIIKVEVDKSNSAGDGRNVIAGRAIITEQLRQDYKRCTGIFIMPTETGDTLDGVTATLKIAGNEILPVGFDLGLITFNGRVSMAQTIYDFTRENIPSSSSDLELVVDNMSSRKREFSVYMQLEN